MNGFCGVCGLAVDLCPRGATHLCGICMDKLGVDHVDKESDVCPNCLSDVSRGELYSCGDDDYHECGCGKTLCDECADEHYLDCPVVTDWDEDDDDWEDE